MRGFAIFLFLTSAFIIIISAFAWQGIYLPIDANSQEEKVFIVEKGEGTREIALKLEREGFIMWGPLFRLYTLYEGISVNLQAGEYLLSSSLTIPEIAEKLASGKVIKETITIIEGWNLRDIGWHFENSGMFQAEELFELVGFPLSAQQGSKDFSGEFDFLQDKPKILNLEGYLFPDTYYFRKQGIESNEQRLEEIVKKALSNFDEKLTPELREEMQSQEKSIFDIVTMASLIEKEVITLEDKKLVSGVLWKRLKAGMPLQVDATIVYITGKPTTSISIEETKIDSLYNTYKYQGLPLGPICNPGLESIVAAVYPESSAFWYYLSTPEGETIFSRTLEEHNIAKAKYLK